MLSFLSMPWVWVVGLAVAAFLVLFWALRGAPIGQAAQGDDAVEAPRAGYRDRVVAAAVVGLLLVAAGAYVAASVSIPWSLPLFAVGFGIVIALVSINRRYRHASPTLRRTLQFANTALATALIAGVLIVGNVMAFKYGGRAIDFTSERAFSLSPLTISEVKTLPKPVTFTVFLVQPAVGLRVLQLLDLYKAENPSKVKVEVMNPLRDLEQFEQLQKRVPDVAVAAREGGGVVIEYGEAQAAERLVIQGTELFEARPAMNQADPRRFETTFNGEDAITSALIRLRAGKRTRVAFSTGHGEPSIEPLETSQPGLGLLRSRLQHEGLDAIELNLLRDQVPADVSLLFIVAPRSAFQSEEVAHVREFLKRGGHLVACLGQDKSGLDEFLKTYKLELGTYRIVEPRDHFPRGRVFSLAILIGTPRHPIVDSLSRRRVVLPDCVAITITQSGPNEVAGASIVARPILQTSRESWAETDPSSARVERDPKADPAGPFTVAAAVTEQSANPAGGPPSSTPRLVVFSSPNLADNRAIAVDAVNLDLVMNAVHWLGGRPELQGIAPKTHVAMTFMADPATRARLILVPTLMATLVIIATGTIVYMYRRT